jgi:hypothetical protein
VAGAAVVVLGRRPVMPGCVTQWWASVVLLRSGSGDGGGGRAVVGLGAVEVNDDDLFAGQVGRSDQGGEGDVGGVAADAVG